ncbi:baseplate J/gp47 family protein [Ulvibacter litoralis]|uniref:Baseplate J-like protein n=1 Tax=Ulvibacter litoralis TaxID=227084 RepID=A0A1G7HHW8_9FLAO|nr:baseplate J/gp47 family protein [Ulvibacter litoralis]GHC57894.1 hypothetical protein GCM10008083_23160 [Ulvibacter litoralis]SDF00072.1 Baseplate J-like protein [Ulvibacter litoralis]
MAKNCENTFLLQHGGTAQSQRFRNALAPENLKLNDFSVAEWMQFAHTFAKEVNYFSIENDTTPAGTWESFFLEKDKIAAFINEIESGSKLTPHLTLFVCFLKLLEISKNRFNSITKRHLDFYYQEILQIEKKAPVSDQVHLIFEVAKNISETNIEADTFVEAGKDSEGKRLQYTTNKEVVVNKAAVVSLKSVYHHHKKSATEQNALYAASEVNSVDGKGEPFKENPQWLPFGYPQHYKPSLPLDTPKLGFAIASPTLNLQEGHRDILFHYATNKAFTSLTNAQLSEVIEVYATGEKGWLGPYKIETTSKTGFATVLSGNVLDLFVAIPKSEPAITPYNQEIHGEGFTTTHPVFRFLLKTTQPEYAVGYSLYTQLVEKRILAASIKVTVSEAENVILRNDLGNLAANKPFHPFGAQPIAKSAFYVDYPEAFSKKWTNIQLKGDWLNTPPDFREHYIAYRKNNSSRNLSPSLYYKTLYQEFTDGIFQAVKEVDGFKITANTPTNLYVDDNDYFKAKVTLNNNETTDTLTSNHVLFSSEGDPFQLQLSVNAKSNYVVGKTGPLKLALNQSFLHAIFPQVYALAITNTEDTLLPNEPYTPILEKLYLTYTATQMVNFLSPPGTTKNLDKIQLFHEHPFGQAENNNTIVPKYCVGGALYIGLTNTKALQQVQLLFQLLEGTENPLATSFTQNEKIEWAVLSGNDWFPLQSNHLLGNTTDNFLKTGIVTVSIPREASIEHSLLPSGMVWLRAKTDKSFDTVCRFMAIKAQVVTATFRNNNNELSHLENGLPSETISKLTQRDAHIKSISQPYGTFGGSPEESDSHYYQRISERIRHRDRAINLWDYEHLILEKFPEVHKVKCLTHTLDSNFHAPGNVALVVIPDTVNQNAFDIFQPRLSTAKRNEIQSYINQLNTLFVTAQIINPQYEEIKVSLKVRFNTGFDEHFYTTKLEEDIKEYLSPWAYKTTAGLRFGVTFHKSKLIAYIEQLPYVDFLDSVVLRHIKTPETTGEVKTNIVPSSPKAILVSAKQHDIESIQSNCKKKTPNTDPICLP